ncbi:MAG: GNAT family N-acetyltransferase [Polycyclovorans sp.]|nr:GNAT family N-acetyltransferase [Polycyclovorans sp.]
MLTIIEADLKDSVHRAGIVECIDAYAKHEMGGQRPLTAEVKAAMVPGLERAPSKLILLALSGANVVGVAVCFMGFSTFSAKPRLNLHDLSVLPEFRGKGVGRKLLESVIGRATELGCSAVTLEVRKDNENARHLYRSVGFSDWLSPLEFWERKL